MVSANASPLGLRLSSIFVSVGLPQPHLTFEMLVEGSPGSEIYEYSTETVRSLLPRMEQLGIATAAIAQVDTLAERLRREAATLHSIVGVMPLMGAWCRKPGIAVQFQWTVPTDWHSACDA